MPISILSSIRKSCSELEALGCADLIKTKEALVLPVTAPSAEVTAGKKAEAMQDKSFHIVINQYFNSV